jgi:hypothetical protein
MGPTKALAGESSERATAAANFMVTNYWIMTHKRRSSWLWKKSDGFLDMEYRFNDAAGRQTSKTTATTISRSHLPSCAPPIPLSLFLPPAQNFFLFPLKSYHTKPILLYPSTKRDSSCCWYCTWRKPYNALD